MKVQEIVNLRLKTFNNFNVCELQFSTFAFYCLKQNGTHKLGVKIKIEKLIQKNRAENRIQSKKFPPCMEIYGETNELMRFELFSPSELSQSSKKCLKVDLLYIEKQSRKQTPIDKQNRTQSKEIGFHN